MIERALAQHARPAPRRRGDDLVAVAERPRGAFVGRTEYRRDPRAGCGGQMHRAGIVRDQRAADREDAGKRRHVGAPDQRQQRTSLARESPFDVGRSGPVGRGSNQHRLNAVAGQRARQPGEALRRPALRAAVCGARREGDQR